MWPYERKRVALAKEFYLENPEKTEWDSVRIPEPIYILDKRLMPHLVTITTYEDYQSAKATIDKFLDSGQFERRIEWQQRNTLRFHWCGAVLKTGGVVVFQLNYELLREYNYE